MDKKMTDKESRDFISTVLENFRAFENSEKDYDADNIYKKVIKIYYAYVDKPAFSDMVNEYKNKYIYNEARVEQNLTDEEISGLGLIYDYISNYDFDKQQFMYFLEAFKIHMLLYKCCPDSSFGGALRNTDPVLKDFNIEVMPYLQAQKHFNEMINVGLPETEDVIEYIDECVKINVDMIHTQPFYDGNKRTFRAVLNLMLKKVNIPPLYITSDEVDSYHDALRDAMDPVNPNFTKINTFYHHKICDAIENLDIKKSVIHSKDVTL